MWTAELARLTSRLSSIAGIVLVVDNAHLLRSRTSTKVLSTLLEHVPPGSTLALVGRVTPGLAIARLRASGKLLELQAGDLALSRREGEALLRGLDAGLADDDARDLLDRCEGWAAGIRLSALASVDRADERAVPGGDDRFLAEYFRSEFLEQLTPDMLTFLRRTSVLEHLTAPVCDAVLKRKDSGRVLASLDRLPLLFAPLDRHGEAYRCHPLFRDLLARELTENEPELGAALHRRAADWFEAHDDPEAALIHAEGSGDVDRHGAHRGRDRAARLLPGPGRRRRKLARHVRRRDATRALPRRRRDRRLGPRTRRPPVSRRALARSRRARRASGSTATSPSRR